MAWNLAELSKIETSTLRKSVIDTLIMESNLMELCPWETIGQLATTVVRIKDLPSVGFRKVNEGYSESIGHFEQKVENISLFGGDIDTDIAIARAKNTVADARAIQQTLKLKAVAYDFNDNFINGNPTSDPEEYKGLNKRVDDVYNEGFTDQKVDLADTTDYGILRDSAARFNFLDKVNTLIYAIKGHSPDYLLMNKKLLLAFRSLLLREKLLETTSDMFNRRIDMYLGARLIDIGVKADQSTEIITNTETDGGGSYETSIYAVKFGIGDSTWGIQQYPIEVRDLGEIDSKPVFRTRVDWNLGLATVDPRSVGRLYGIRADSTSS
jgi:hypothetical protein